MPIPMSVFIQPFYLEKRMSVIYHKASSKIVTTLILLFLLQFVLTTALTVVTETTNPATRVMGSSNAAIILYII